MHIIDERMEHLREKMRERQMDAYLVLQRIFMNLNMWEIILPAESF